MVSSSARGTYDWNHPGFLEGMKTAISGMEMKGINAKISTAHNGGQAA
jgi:hypothetical protein